MSKKITFGIVLISLFILSSIFAIMPENTQSNEYITANSNNLLTNSFINVTHPSDLELLASDTTNQTISWTLTENSSRDYFGIYNFTNDPVGGHPTGWTVTESVDATLQVINEYTNHRKVVEFWDDFISASSAYTHMEQTFSSRTSGTVELWVYGKRGHLNHNSLGISLWSGSTLAIHTFAEWSSGVEQYINCRGNLLLDQVIVPSPNFPDQQWMHIRIDFNCVSDTFVCYVNGVNRGTFNFKNAVLSISKFSLGTGQVETGGNFYAYVDAVDYSWAPGYYLNRNMNNTPIENLTELAICSVFQNGIQKMPWQQWNKQVQLDFKVSGFGLGFGIHNISLVFNNSKNSWSHDDVMVTVKEDQKPNIAQVTQDIKTVTAHILDNTQIQSVYVETNSTGTSTGNYLGVHSFLNDQNGAVPEGWDLIFLQGAAHMYVTEAKAGHHKVLEGYDNGPTSAADILNCWPVRPSGSIELWFCGMLGIGTAQDMNLFILGMGTQGECVGSAIIMDLDAGRIDYTNGTTHTVCSVDLTQWTHLLIDFNCNTDKFNLTVNGVLRGVNLGFIKNVTTSTGLQISSGWGSTGGFYFYVDPVDYSWAPGYFLNRNMAQNSFDTYSMTLESGTLQDGTWTYTFIPPPLGDIIAFRVYAQDIWGNINYTEQFNINYSDPICPKIENVVQMPIEPGYQEPVNVTVHIIDNTKIQTVVIESNFTGNVVGDSMTLLNGSQNDGVWGYTFNNYPTNKTISYRILAQDTFGNWNTTEYFSFGYFDTLGPNILSVIQAPSEPTYLDIVNVTAHIIDATEVQTVSIETNYTGALSTYPMTLLSGSSQDGVWKYSFGVVPINKSIFYRIITSDVLGNQNSTGYYGFGYFDILGPNIISISQAPSTPNYLDIVNVTVHITDATLVQTVSIQTNYTGTLSTYPMTLISGSASDGVWKYVFNTYPLNVVITYSISTQDIFGNYNSSAQSSFGVFDLIDPAILIVGQTPATLTRWDSVQVTSHVQENFALGSVMINSNHTGSWANYPMVLLNGSLQDGFWGFTIANYPYNKSIWYRVSAIDVMGRTTTTGYSQFGIFPIVSNHVPLDLEIDVDVGMAGNRKADITFTFQNTGNTNLVNINFTIHLPIGWTANTLVRSVSQLAPGQTVTITFKITVPSNIGEFLELVLIDMDARISELGMDWPTQSIEVVVSGVKVWDLFIWLIVIVGSCSAAVATTYVYIHKRSASQKVLKNKFKGKTLISLKTAISNDFPGSYAVISIELMERINNISGLTDEERQLLIDDVAQLNEEQAKKWIDDYEKSLIQ